MFFKVHKKLFAKLGLSNSEAKVILFLAFLFITGIYIFYFKPEIISTVKAYDFVKHPKISPNSKVIENKSKKGVDSNKIVYQISGNKLKFSSLKENEKINLQNASIYDLMKLPFITKLKAESIIKLRNEGKISSGIDLVKSGILTRDKFEKIKMFIINEKNKLISEEK